MRYKISRGMYSSRWYAYLITMSYHQGGTIGTTRTVTELRDGNFCIEKRMCEQPGLCRPRELFSRMARDELYHRGVMS